MLISVICVYNNKQQLESQLHASLQTQDAPFEFIPLDNTGNMFHSAAAALNHGARMAKGDVLIFSHQDIFLKASTELYEFADMIMACDTGTVIGAIGVKEPSKVYYGNYSEGQAYHSELSECFEKNIYPVSCVDECFFGMKWETWEAHPFDEKLCDNWHLYAVEACLWARKNGHKVCVYPSQIHHFSRGRISLGYMKNLRELCKVYRNDFKYIWTTCYKVRTHPVYINGLVLLWMANRFIKGTLK